MKQQRRLFIAEQVSPSSAWSMERARTSPEHSSCESLAQGEPGRHDEELAVDESRYSLPFHSRASFPSRFLIDALLYPRMYTNVR